MEHQISEKEERTVKFKKNYCTPASSRTPEEAIAAALFNLDIMEKIFPYLSLEEQNIFRLVCCDWYAMAHIFWANSNYDCEREFSKHKSSLRIFFDLKKRPLLKSVKCNLNRSQNLSVILAVVDYIDDVHHLDLHVVAPWLVKQIVNKFKNLESVLLDVKSPDITESIYLLKQCPKLKKLELCHCFKQLEKEHKLPSLFKVLAEDDYPNLQYLIIPIRSMWISEGLTYLLHRRNKNITFLELKFFEYSDSIYSAINLCTNLKELKLMLHSPKNHFQLFQLLKLKDLTLSFCGEYTEDVVKNTFLNPVASGLFKGLQSLKLQLSVEESKLDVMQLIGTNLTTLKSLSLWNVDKKKLDDHLKYIVGMNSLTFLLIFGSFLTASGTSSINKLRNLRILKLINCSLTDNAIFPLRQCQLVQNFLISSATLTTNTLIHVISHMRNLKSLGLTKCGISHPDKIHVTEACDIMGCTCHFTD